MNVTVFKDPIQETGKDKNSRTSTELQDTMSAEVESSLALVC